MRPFLPIFAVVALSMTGSTAMVPTPARASDAPQAIPGRFVQQLRPAHAGHKVVAMWLDTGNPQAGIPAGYTKVESTTVACPKSPGTCTLALNVMDQVYYPPTDIYWAIVVSVDGNIVDGGPYQDFLPTDGNDIGNWSGAYAVGAGNHEIEFETYTQSNAYQGAWSVNWTVTTP